ncbi:hypothetical protein EJB05_35202 [Eragrostis curvula]|uniref:Uncharacterized protein n=1 Tax=Eragrostis curvula TaxID=38414 RepID=A0A5J9U5S2_9POAL|nr:hypothetical protein EJB05_35202 [Eragrostis curvula]
MNANNNDTELAQVAAAATNMNTEEVEATPPHEVSSRQLTKAVRMEETSDGTILKSPVADQVMGSPG